MTWWQRALVALGVAFGALFMILVVGIVGLVLYWSLNGGLHYTTHEKVDGIECIVVRNRISGSAGDVSCPPIQSRK